MPHVHLTYPQLFLPTIHALHAHPHLIGIGLGALGLFGVFLIGRERLAKATAHERMAAAKTGLLLIRPGTRR